MLYLLDPHLCERLDAAELQLVGVARVDITPDYPVRLSGYGSRRAEHEGVEQRIFAKALAIGSDADGPAVLLTVDNCGVSADMRAEVVRRLAAKTGITDERLAICSSHTHSAPMINGVLPNLFSMDIPPEHLPNIDRYTRELTDKLEQVALAALADRRPAQLGWAVGKVEFARNRRGIQSTPNGVGPVDHDLALLRVADPEGKPRAVLVNYACHCTTVGFNRIHGDWAGSAQQFIEADFPGAIALTAIGCGADQNPNPRGTFELANQHGRTLADEARRLLAGKLTPITGKVAFRTKSIELPYDKLPTRAELEERAKNPSANIAYIAKKNLARLDRGESLPTKLPYLVQAWSFGDALAMVFLPGEVVVDYTLRLKREFDVSRIWVNAYANDVPCYIPSERVLREGGYEGEGAMVYYDRPAKFAPGVEDRIVAAMHEVVPKSFLAGQRKAALPRAKTPAEALASIVTKTNFVVELVAAEPLVVDPVAVDFGADGRLWVVEMHDYPTGLDGNWKPGGRIKYLTDTNSDGRMDVATMFLDGIPFPTGVMAWGKGALVCTAPDILYAEDTNGDGRADKVEKLFTGFVTDNYQARVNALALGLDNWIYGANGLRGGVVQPVGADVRRLTSNTHPNQSLVTSAPTGIDISGRDFRLNPHTRAFEPVAGLSQQGRVRDDWGNWFGCDNSHLLWHYPLPDHYARRNPHVTYPSPRVEPSPGDAAHRVFPISTPLERFNRPDHADRVTAACGLGLYRDDLLGTNYTGNAFICEPAHNLVTRRLLTPRGATFTAARASDKQASEFLASTDPWFRPVQTLTGPDGALWIVDMYRLVIEHPRWIPPDRLAGLDVRAGADKGRIYRVYPKGKKLRPIPDLTKPTSWELAKALNTNNGAQRDLVHGELLHRQDKAAAPILAAMTANAALPGARVQALCALDGIGALTGTVLLAALSDAHPAVRAQAVRLTELTPLTRPADTLSPRSEGRGKEPAASQSATAQPGRDALPRVQGRTRSTASLPEVHGEGSWEPALKMTGDGDFTVRYQLALSLGEWNDPRAGAALAKLAVKDMGDEWMRAAILSSATNHAHTILKAVLATPVNAPGRGEMTGQLIATLAATGGEAALGELLQSLIPATGKAAETWQWIALASLQDALDQRKVRVASLPLAKDASAESAAARLKQTYAAAHALALDTKADSIAREAAIRLHGRGFNDAAVDLPRLVTLLRTVAERQLQAVVLEQLRRSRDERLPGLLFTDWNACPPSLRQIVVELLATREPWTKALLGAVEKGLVSVGEIPIGRKDLLQRHANEEIKSLARKVLGAPAGADRTAVVERYQAALKLTGDRAKGKDVFVRVCAQCHALDGQGFNVGPDLAAFRSKPASDWLVAILNPNAVVEPRFVTYNAELKDGRSLSGVVTDETATGFTLVQAGGVKQLIRREEVTELRASALSLMPEGLEQGMTPQELADLLAYVSHRL